MLGVPWPEAVPSFPSPSPLLPGASSVLVGAAASVTIAFLTDAVFGPAGGHVFASKLALCSSLGVCIHYAQVIILLRTGGGGDRRPPWARGSSSSGRGVKPETAGAGATGGGGGGARTAFTAGLAALYCAGLFSNSFIEAEDGLHRFLGASSLLSLSVLLLLNRGPAGRGTGNTGSSGSNGGDRLRTLLGLSPTSTAALYAALAAALLRAAAGVQDVAAEAGVSTEAAFGFARSLCPLPALWWLCRMARGGGGVGGVGGAEKEAGAAGAAVGSGLFSSAGRSLSRSGGGVGGRSAQGSLSGGACGLCFDGVLQAVSLAAIGAYWLNEARVAGLSSPSVGTAAAESTGSVPGGGSSFGVLLPVRLLLPRVVYLLCLSGLVVGLVFPPVGRAKQQQRHSSKKTTSPPQRGRDEAHNEEYGGVVSLEAPSAGGRGEASSYAQALANTAGTVVSHLLPVVVLLLGPGSPAVVAFVVGACGCFLRGVSLAAGVEAVPLGAVAVAWSVVGRTFFFLTGHHNQFSRLQYSSAFVGEFDIRIYCSRGRVCS